MTVFLFLSSLLLAHSSVGYVGYILFDFIYETIEGIQPLLIGIFIYASMSLDASIIVLLLRQTRVKYKTDLGALAKTNPILTIYLILYNVLIRRNTRVLIHREFKLPNSLKYTSDKKKRF